MKEEYRHIDAEFRNLPEEIADDGISRRKFLKMIGGGIVVLFVIDESMLFGQQRGGSRYPTDFNAYLRIGEDGRVACCVGKIEMGQGIITGLAQMCAEELDVALDAVDMTMGDTALCPFDMLTVGSLTTRQTGPRLRRASAEARAILVQLAAEKLSVPESRLKTRDGYVFDSSNEKTRVTYGDLARGKSIQKHLDKDPELKPLSEYTLCGKDFKRTDGAEKVTGKAKFTGDIRVDSLLYARVLRPPAHGAKLLKVDASAAEKIAGVQVVQDSDMVAVLHPCFDVADAALKLVKAEYDEPKPEVDRDTIHDYLIKVAPEPQLVEESGNLAEGEKLATHIYEETFVHGYVAHAPMEPHSAMADVKGDKATVWASTQGPFTAQQQVAGIVGGPQENSRIITPFVGGGFGGKTHHLQVMQATKLSKLLGKPVQVAWTREDEFFWDTFMPAAVVKIRAGLNDAGEIVLWDYVNYFGGSRSSEPFYAIPHYKVVARGSWGRRGAGADLHPFGIGAWRGPGSNTNTFAREAFMNLLAEKAEMDALEFRMKNLKDKRMIRVVEAAAKKFGWIYKKAPSGRGHGVSLINYHDTYVASMAEVSVNKSSGHVQVKRIVAAQDMGEVVNPAGAHAQILGGINMGLGFALSEEINFKGSKIFSRNFDDYEIPRFSWTPEIETILVENNALPPSGGGEPAISTVGGLIAGAVHDATGLKLTRLPLTAERVLAKQKT